MTDKSRNPATRQVVVQSKYGWHRHMVTYSHPLISSMTYSNLVAMTTMPTMTTPRQVVVQSKYGWHRHHPRFAGGGGGSDSGQCCSSKNIRRVKLIMIIMMVVIIILMIMIIVKPSDDMQKFIMAGVCDCETAKPIFFLKRCFNL